MKIKAVAYARYSSDKQQESSIVVQLAAIHRFCEMHNIELIREYIDEAQTGTNANRKSFQKMIEDAQEKTFQLVIVHRIDRWARNVDDARYYKRVLAKSGVKIVSSIEEFDESPEGEFFELMSFGMAELFSKKLSREASAGKLANAREGKAHGGTPPLGYVVRNKRYVIDEKEAEIVKLIFSLFAEGYSYTYIRDYLNSKGYRHADGRLFTKHFYDILTNRKYLGEYTYNRASSKDAFGHRNNHRSKKENEIIRIKGAMPQIIDDKTFDIVQHILANRQRGVTGMTGKPRKYLLSGLLSCKDCNRAICGTNRSSHRQKELTYSPHTDGSISCKTKSINAVYLEDYIHLILCKTILIPANKDRLVSLVKECYLHSFDRIREYRDKMRQKIQETENLLREKVTSFPKETSKLIYECIEDEIEDLTIELKKLKFELEFVEEELNKYPGFSARTIESNAKKLRARLSTGIMEEEQKALRSIISKIQINNSVIEVGLNFGALLGTVHNITCTLIENRDSVALLSQHHKINYKFEDMLIRL